MDLFKFLKKKKADSFEDLLKKAATDPSSRAEFVKRILTEDLVVLTGNKFEGEAGLIRMEVGAKISIFSYADKRIPIFTSPERIFDKGLFKGNPQYFQAQGADIFELLKGANLILNPYSDYGKAFTPVEVQNLLQGRLTDLKEIKYDKATPIKIGQPAKYPTEIVAALKMLFKTKPDVLTAYLGWFHDPATVDPPHYIFAIETTGDWRSLSDEVGFIGNQFMPDNEIFDLVKITKDDGFLNDYFTKQTKPFYTKA
jgi:hypothetical protein